jgi:hypothetical protein
VNRWWPVRHLYAAIDRALATTVPEAWAQPSHVRVVPQDPDAGGRPPTPPASGA